MRSPVIALRDTELIKQLAVKEFDHFTDHVQFVNETVDTLFGNSVFLMKGQKWRDMRATLSPAFTSSKMKLMYQLIIENAEQMSEFLTENCQDELVEFEMKELCSRVTNDIIAHCAFGLKIDSLQDRTNAFYMTGQKTLEFTQPSKTWKLLLFQVCPKIMQIFDIQFFDKKSRTFIKNIVLDMLKVREEKNIVRHDMINLLLEARKGTLKYQEDDKLDSMGIATVYESEIGKQAINKRTWSDDELVSQCFTFFQAGFDTSSTLMSFAIYEMTKDVDVQQKLYEEVKEIHDNLNGQKLSYEIVQKMKYMDMVVSETLRLWPPIPATDRVCVKPLNFDDGNGLKYNFQVGDGIWIPISGFHADPKHFPEPEKFDPERFSDERKDDWDHRAFMPFGVGPRACIGSRFALMEAKTVLFYLTLNFTFHVIEKTQIPMRLKNGTGGPLPEKDIWVGLKSRNAQK